MVALDKRLYLDVNRLARRSGWAHSSMTALYDRIASPLGAGLLVLVALVLLAWVTVRRQPERMPAVVWAAVGPVIAFGLAQIIIQALAKPRPYQVLRHVEVLVPRGGPASYAFPDGRAVLAGAVLCGILLARRWRLAAAAFVVTIALTFSAVYVGAAYPSDVGAGLAFGLVVAAVLWPLGSWLITPVVDSVAHGPFAWAVVSRATSRRLGRQLVLQGPTTSLPTAKAMDALRLATEAAHHGPSPTGATAGAGAGAGGGGGAGAPVAAPGPMSGNGGAGTGRQRVLPPPTVRTTRDDVSGPT